MSIAKKYRVLPMHLWLFGSWILVGCEALNNATKTDATENKSTANAETDVDEESGTSGSANLYKKGEVFIQQVDLTASQALTTNFSYAWTSLAESLDENMEISVVDSEGRELKYERAAMTSTSMVFTPPETGTYEIILKSNADKMIEMPGISNEGANAVRAVEAASDRQGDGLASTILKGVVVVSRQCISLDQDGNGVTTTAPSGRYFVQPMIFFGRVADDKSVLQIADAKISIVAGEDKINLKALADMSRNSYRDIYASNSSLTDEEERQVTRMFYQGYFGAAGELYTVDTFRKGGDCSQAGTIALSGDVGAQNLSLNVVDEVLDIDSTIELRATVAPAFSLYESSQKKVSDWTQCTYNKQTAEPTPYNGDANECKQVSLTDTPYLTLDYAMASATRDGIASGLTAQSDPTRVLYYGYSYTKDWQKHLVDHSAELIASESPVISLDTCLSNGGLIAVPLKTEKTPMPVHEFNAQPGDVISLASKSGSYTALPEFFQGNVEVKGTYKLATCIPSADSSCADYKLVTVNVKACTIKADSGISVTSISDSYIYPDYFSISGVVVD